MAKRANTYQLTLEPLTLASGAAATREPLRLTIENHDELFTIIDRLQAKDPRPPPCPCGRRSG